MDEKMTLEEVRSTLDEWGCSSLVQVQISTALLRKKRDALDTHLTTPAQTVDVDAWISVQEKLPASGALVLAYYLNSANRGRTVRAHYAAPKSEEASWESDFCDYDETTDTYWCPEGWYETNENEETHWMIVETVTHWMPLPNPPESKP